MVAELWAIDGAGRAGLRLQCARRNRVRLANEWRGRAHETIPI